MSFNISKKKHVIKSLTTDITITSKSGSTKQKKIYIYIYRGYHKEVRRYEYHFRLVKTMVGSLNKLTKTIYSRWKADAFFKRYIFFSYLR